MFQIEKKQIAYNRTKRTDGIKYIVIHDTGNKSKSANADSHFNYFNGGSRGASADFFVDDKKILQINDYKKHYTWQVGDGKGKFGIKNSNSLGIEICVNADGNYDKAFHNAVELTKHLMKELSIPTERVIRHYDASRKNCPASMGANNWALWDKFKTALRERELDMTQYEELKAEIAKLQRPMIYNYIDDNMPEWAREGVKWCLDNGIIKGTGEGLGLDDKDLKYCTIMMRLFKTIKGGA